MMLSTRVSALIPTRNRSRQIQEILDNLGGQEYPPFEVIIVDASDDHATELIAKEFVARSKRFALRYFKAPEKGLTKQRNFGIAQAVGECILMLDDDVILDRAFLRLLVEEIERDEKKKIGGVSGVITNYEPTLLIKIGFYKLFGIDFGANGRVLRNSYAVPVLLQSCQGRMEVDWLQGGLTLWRREVFAKEKYSRFFENWGYAEDVEFSFRVGRSYKLICIPEARCLHFHAKGGRGSTVAIGEMVIRNRYYIFKKHIDNKHWWEWLAFYWSLVGVAFMLLMGCVVRPKRWGEFLGLSIGVCWGFLSSWYFVEKKIRETVYTDENVGP